MDIYEADGRTLRRTYEVVHYILKWISQTEAITSEVDNLEVHLQTWGCGGSLHFAGIHVQSATPVLIKVGVSRREQYWTEQVFRRDPVLVPRLFMTGDQLDELKVRWMVLEALPYGPLGPLWRGHEFALLTDAAVKFQRIAREIPAPNLPSVTKQHVHAFLQAGRAHHPPGPVNDILEHLDRDYEWVAQNCPFAVCHGDLHLCNALTRVPPPHGPAILIDFSPVVQPWAFDAACLQVLNSTEKNRRGVTHLVQKMAARREAEGLPTCSEWGRLERIVLAWFAIQCWGSEFDRHSIPDYREMIQCYIEAGAAV